MTTEHRAIRITDFFKPEEVDTQEKLEFQRQYRFGVAGRLQTVTEISAGPAGLVQVSWTVAYGGEA